MSDRETMPDAGETITAVNIAVRGGVGPIDDGGIGVALCFKFTLPDGSDLPEIVLFMTGESVLKVGSVIAKECEGTFLQYAQQLEEEKRAKAAQN